MQPQVLSGWRAILKINNEPFAAAFVMDYSIDTGVTAIQGVDNVYTDELAPERVDVMMNLKVYRTPENDPVALGISPGGDSIGDIEPQAALTSSPYISIEIRDKITDKTVLFLPKAWVTRRSGSVEAENLLVETWSIKSIGYIGPGGQTSSLVGVVKNIFS